LTRRARFGDGDCGSRTSKVACSGAFPPSVLVEEKARVSRRRGRGRRGTPAPPLGLLHGGYLGDTTKKGRFRRKAPERQIQAGGPRRKGRCNPTHGGRGQRFYPQGRFFPNARKGAGRNTGSRKFSGSGTHFRGARPVGRFGVRFFRAPVDIFSRCGHAPRLGAHAARRKDTFGACAGSMGMAVDGGRRRFPFRVLDNTPTGAAKLRVASSKNRGPTAQSAVAPGAALLDGKVF